MFSIKQEEIKEINEKVNKINRYDYNNCIYSSGVSRPSKSLINCELYKIYSKLNLEIIDEFSSIKKKKEYYLLKEIINIFKLDTLYLLDNETLSISFDTILINEIEINNENKNLIMCFDNDISLRNIIVNLNSLIKELNNGDSLIINYHHLFIYPSAELLHLISILFKKVKIYYSKLLKQNILYCIDYVSNNNINIFIRNILKKWNKNSNIRQFGIFIDESLFEKIKIFNNTIFDYYINLNNNFALSSIEDKEYLLKIYLKTYCKNKENINENENYSNHSFICNHDIVEFNLMNCFICKKCYDLFQLY